MSVDLGALLLVLLVAGVLVGAITGWVLLITSDGPRMRFRGARLLWMACFVLAPVLACILWIVVPRIEDALDRRAASDRPQRQPGPAHVDEPQVVVEPREG